MNGSELIPAYEHRRGAAAPAVLIFADGFTYADGALQTVSAGAWSTFDALTSTTTAAAPKHDVKTGKLTGPADGSGTAKQFSFPSAVVGLDVRKAYSVSVDVVDSATSSGGSNPRNGILFEAPAPGVSKAAAGVADVDYVGDGAPFLLRLTCNGGTTSTTIATGNLRKITYSLRLDVSASRVAKLTCVWAWERFFNSAWTPEAGTSTVSRAAGVADVVNRRNVGIVLQWASSTFSQRLTLDDFTVRGRPYV